MKTESSIVDSALSIAKVKMERRIQRTCVDPAIEALERLYAELPQNPNLKNQIQTLYLDLRFFKMFFWGLEFWDAADNDLHLCSVMTSMVRKFRQSSMEFNLGFKGAFPRGKITFWELRSSELVEIINRFKPQARECCIVFLHGAFRCKSYYNVGRSIYAADTGDFIGFILDNLDLLSFKVDLIASVKKQIGFIERVLKVFRNFAYLVTHWTTGGKNLGKLLLHIRTWANHISCLACLYWMDKMDESLAGTMRTMLSDLMRKNMPCKPNVIALYFDILRATRYQNFSIQKHQLAQLAAMYVDFLLENLYMPLKDDIEIFREGLMFLLTFVMDPPGEDSSFKKLLLTRADAIMSLVPSVICSLHFDKMKEGNPVSKRKFFDFLQKINDRVKAEVRELYVLIPHSSQFNSPRTNAIGFLDCLLENLKKMLEEKENFNSFVKHKVEMIQEELSWLRPFLQNDMDQQNKHDEFKKLWTRIINVVYYAAYVTNFCSLTDVPIWYSIISLSVVIEDIKIIKLDVRRIEDDQMCNNKKLTAEIESSYPLLPQVMLSRTEGAFVGFKEDARSIIDHLERGRKDLTIISISGMPGQGKTTLAKRIYDDPIIQYHFHKMVWCYVSKECRLRELLIKAVRDVSSIDVKVILELQIHDLIEHLWKSLRKQRYLIVLDDIWNIDVWRKVEAAFPDDSNGSRIMFTSRNHNLASQAKPNSISYPLQLFSYKESWELMKEKLFSCDSFPPEFLTIGKRIAIYCKGLPLAVVLTATLLGKGKQKLKLWKKVAKNLKSYLASEGCMDMIELSYKNLPDHLKSCFLYFGAFPRGEYISAKKLKLLWIAEGFVKENEKHCAEDLADEYLDYLVSLSLVVVTGKRSNGGIKTCNVHDLIYDFCLEKAMSENFLGLADKNIVYQCSSNLQKYSHHRLCISKVVPFTKSRTVCTRRELSIGRIHSLLWFHGDSSTPKSQPLELSPFLTFFKVLTVLDLESIFLGHLLFPMEILSIVHLRYIAIWASIDIVPPSITNLWNLQIFIVREPRLKVPLPNAMLKMKSLRFVNIDGCCLFYRDNDQNKSSEVHNIVTLCGPILWCDCRTEQFLRKSLRLRKLHCYLVEKFHPERSIWFSIFGCLNELETLRMDFVGKVFHGTNSGKFPVFNFPENLQKLTLSGFKLPWSVMSTVGKMPNLEILQLEEKACEGTTWDLEDGDFRKLRFLKLRKLDIVQLNVSSEPFPRLEEFLVIRCYRLEEIPSSFGDICTLKTIKVLWSYGASNSAWQIWEEQREMGNDSFEILSETSPDLHRTGDTRQHTVAERLRASYL